MIGTEGVLPKVDPNLLKNCLPATTIIVSHFIVAEICIWYILVLNLASCNFTFFSTTFHDLLTNAMNLGDLNLRAVNSK